jgi:hypothetical protein
VQQYRVDIRYQQSVIDVKKTGETFAVHVGDPKGQPAGQITCGRVICPTRKTRGCSRSLPSGATATNGSPRQKISSGEPSGNAGLASATALSGSADGSGESLSIQRQRTVGCSATGAAHSS